MTTLQFTDTHNLVAFLTKSAESEGFEQIVDFLNTSSIRYALTVNPNIYTSCIEQFWATVKVKTVNGEQQLQALVDGKKIIITEATVRRDLQLEDANGVDCLTEAYLKKKWVKVQRCQMIPITPIITQPSSSQPQRKQKSRRPKEKDTQAPQPSGPTTNVSDEAFTKENVSKHSNDPLLSGEDSMKLKELMELCTNLQQRVINLETTKTTQGSEIAGLKRRVKKLENKNKSRTHKLNRLYKEDASKQGRKIHDIDVDEDITLENVRDAKMFDVNDLDGDEVVVESEVADKDVNLSVDEVTLAQALAALKSAKVQEKGDVIKEPSVPVGAASTKIKDKGKSKMVEEEPMKKMSKKEILKLDKELAFKLQAEEDEEERLAKLKSKKSCLMQKRLHYLYNS
ncbi:hypothetical protein Tco_0934050 [Tanacetum coccineum]